MLYRYKYTPDYVAKGSNRVGIFIPILVPIYTTDTVHFYKYYRYQYIWFIGKSNQYISDTVTYREQFESYQYQYKYTSEASY